jgi:Asp/Glu/hydantoin racemase
MCSGRKKLIKVLGVK